MGTSCELPILPWAVPKLKRVGCPQISLEFVPFKPKGAGADEPAREGVGVKGTEASGRSETGEDSAAATGTVPAVLPGPPAAAQTQAQRRRRVAFGVVGLCCFMLAAVMAAIYSHSTRAEPEDTPKAEDSLAGMWGFTASILDSGWTRYESSAEGISLALPPGWGPFSTDQFTNEYGTYLRFSASTSYPLPAFAGSSALLVFEIPVPEGAIPRSYYEELRTQVSSSPTQPRMSPLTDTELRDGRAYVFTSVFDTPRGENSETVYGLLHGTTEYRLVFIAPVRSLDEQLDEFHDIARTFDLTT
jgi:hypothetical protein